MDKLNISVEEVCKTIHKSRDFVINAVQQGMMPGAVVVSKTGIRSVHIPRKAFESYMNEWNTSPTDKVIQALFKKYTKKRHVLQHAPLEKISKFRNYFSTEKESFLWKEENQDKKSHS